MNKIDEIKEALAAATPGQWEVFDTGKLHNEYIKGVKNASGIIADIILTEDARFIAKSPYYITYLLQEIERLQKEEEFWKEAAENQRESNYDLLKKQAILKDALDEIELILTDDTSTQAIEINQTINRAREAL